MELRSVWAQELDEDPVGPGAAVPGAAMVGAVDPPLPVDGEPPAADAFDGPDEPDEPDEADARRPGSAVAWLAALTVLALLLMTLGWWLGRGDGPLSPGVSSGAEVTSGTVPAGVTGASGADGGVSLAGPGGGTTFSGGSGGTGADGADGARGSAGAGTGGSDAAPGGGGTGPGAGPGSGDGDDGDAGAGSGSDPAVRADVDAKVDTDGARAAVDLGVASAPGGAVTAVTVTACTKLSGLKVDATATVTWANGFEETGVKVSGLTLLNLLDPGTLSVKLAGDSFTVPANAAVKVGACLSL